MIEKIYAFGTSHTAGGGFEFNSITNNSSNPNIYKKIINSENHFDFSYPAILGRLSNIEIINNAKQGYGYERVNRKIIETISSENFNKDNSLFLIEVSYWDRKEFFIDDINDYIVCNFHPNELPDNNNLSYANDYYYQSHNTTKFLDKHRELLNDFFRLTYTNYEYLQNRLQESFLHMISLLEFLGIKYYLTNGDIPINPNLLNKFNYKNKILEYKLFNFNNNSEVKIKEWTDEIFNLNLTITNESNGLFKDSHQGYSVSSCIAKTIYNKMIEDNIIEGEFIDNDFKSEWDYVKNIVGHLLI